jgi:hypothetical protein
MKKLMTTLVLAGTALMAQGTSAPPASSSTPAPAKVKKHKAKKHKTPPADSTTNTGKK